MNPVYTKQDVHNDEAESACLTENDKASTSSSKGIAEKKNGCYGTTLWAWWRQLSTFWKRLICIGLFLLMATIAALIIVLLVVVRPRIVGADHPSQRPSPIANGGQTDNATTSEFSDAPIKLALLTNFPDPSLHYDSSAQIWYIFGTNQAAGILQLDRSAQDLSRLALGNVQIAKSEDFQTWTLVNSSSDPLPHPGNWTKQGVTDISSLPYHNGPKSDENQTLTDISLPVPRANVWAPELLQRPSDGQYVLYYAAADDTGAVHCIGAAVASSPDGPFAAGDTPIICPRERGGAIDPAVFVDETDNNAIYLAYKIDGGVLGHGGECGNSKPPIVSTPIMLQRMQDDGLTVDPSSEAIEILDRTAEDGPLVEAPQVIKVGEQYFLFYSSGCTRQPDYKVRYANASNLFGPYQRHEPALLQTKDFRLTAPGSASVRYAGNSLGKGAEGTTGPNGNVVGGQWKLAVHGRLNTTVGGVRALFVAGLEFDGGDVKLVEGNISVTES